MNKIRQETLWEIPSPRKTARSSRHERRTLAEATATTSQMIFRLTINHDNNVPFAQHSKAKCVSVTDAKKDERET